MKRSIAVRAGQTIVITVTYLEDLDPSALNSYPILSYTPGLDNCTRNGVMNIIGLNKGKILMDTSDSLTGGV